MRTDLENYLLHMISWGWASYENGDVEAPTGYFSVVLTNSEQENRIYCAENMIDYPADLEANTFYFVVETSTGALEIATSKDHDEVTRWFNSYLDSFYIWCGDEA